MKIVINNCHGGFGLSYKAVMRYAELKGFKLYPTIDEISKEVYGDKATLDNPKMFIQYSKKEGDTSDEYYFNENDISRDDSNLVQVVEELGDEANGDCAELKIVEIPDNIEWGIEEYDGAEWIAEVHRT